MSAQNLKAGQGAKTRGAFTLIVIAVLAMTNVKAMQLTDLFDFDGTNGSAPNGLTLYSNTLYGMTFTGGTNVSVDGAGDGNGVIFKINTDGTDSTILYEFPTNSQAYFPLSDFVLISNTLYGTAQGGTNGSGIVFRISRDGTDYANLHSFSAITGTAPIGDSVNSDGISPAAIALSSNTLFGTTSGGGAGGCGVVFKINADGTGFEVLHNFSAIDPDTGTNIDGAYPTAALTISGSTLYGTTPQGGVANDGVVFKIGTDGSGFTVLHKYTNSDGSDPGTLTLCSNILYGVTSGGGAFGAGTLFSINTDGTGFTNFYTFDGDSGNPFGKLILSSNVLYGVCGEDTSGSEIFRINTNGTNMIPLYYFDYFVFPSGTLTLSGQSLYGTTHDGGGAYNVGMVFSLQPSAPIITNIVFNTNQSVTLTCVGDPGFKYLMLSETNLLTPMTNWLTISTNIADTNGTWQVTDYSPTNQLYGCITNLIFTNFTPNPFDPSQHPDATNVIGTNVVCGYLDQPACFYRAAVAP